MLALEFKRILVVQVAPAAVCAAAVASLAAGARPGAAGGLSLVRTLGLFGSIPQMSSLRVASSVWALQVAIGDVIAVLLAMVTLLALHGAGVPHSAGPGR